MMRIAALLILSLLWPSLSWSALGIGNANCTATSSNATTVTTAGITTTANSGVVVGLFWDATQNFSSIADSKSNGTPTQIGSEQATNFGKSRFYYYPKLTSAGAAHTWTLTMSGSTQGIVCVLELTTGGNGIAMDQTATFNLDSSSPYTSNSVTTTVADEILVGWSNVDGSGTTTYTDNGGSFTKRAEATDSNCCWSSMISSRTVASTGTYSTNWTLSGTITASGESLASFSEASGGGGGATSRLMLLGVGP